MYTLKTNKPYMHVFFLWFSFWLSFLVFNVYVYKLSILYPLSHFIGDDSSSSSFVPISASHHSPFPSLLDGSPPRANPNPNPSPPSGDASLPSPQPRHQGRAHRDRPRRGQRCRHPASTGDIDGQMGHLTRPRPDTTRAQPKAKCQADTTRHTLCVVPCQANPQVVLAA